MAVSGGGGEGPSEALPTKSRDKERLDPNVTAPQFRAPQETGSLQGHSVTHKLLSTNFLKLHNAVTPHEGAHSSHPPTHMQVYGLLLSQRGLPGGARGCSGYAGSERHVLRGTELGALCTQDTGSTPQPAPRPPAFQQSALTSAHDCLLKAGFRPG